jgi:glycosyltransferase involved in cell wall biosynthesis
LGKLRSTIEKVTTYLGINVAVSSAVATTIPGPTVCIPNGFRSVFDQPGTGERDGLLFVGRLVQEKGVDTAVRALLCLHDRGLRKHLTVCGEGPYQGRIAEEVQELELEEHVTFKGWTSSSTLADLYRGAEATIIPSRRENFGIVAIEAIASGCPVVATNVGGLPEAVGDCGVLVKPDDPAALADGIETVLDPRTRRSLRKAMPLHVDQHRIDRIAGEYLDLFDSVIQDKSE